MASWRLTCTPTGHESIDHDSWWDMNCNVRSHCHQHCILWSWWCKRKWLFKAFLKLKAYSAEAQRKVLLSLLTTLCKIGVLCFCKHRNYARKIDHNIFWVIWVNWFKFHGISNWRISYLNNMLCVFLMKTTPEFARTWNQILIKYLPTKEPKENF